MNIKDLYQKLKKSDYQISTDTRNIIPSSIFFAWRGENNDGNIFVREALEKGCAYAVIDNSEYHIDERCIVVPDSIKTLQDLAHHHRMQFDIPVIGLTGSNGKTTTKELIASVLGSEKNIIATEGNLNNHIGVPKTLLTIRPETEIAIIEMGANHVGEIAELCRIASPTHGLITNIGRAHIGLFGGFENIIRAKTELYRYLEHSGGVSFINGDDLLLLEQSNTAEKITYLSDDSDYPFNSHKSLPFVSGEWNDNVIQTQLTGEYNISNIAAAIAVGDYFDISETSIINGIVKYKPDNQRSEIIETEKGNIVIKDYYNANRSSMELAIQNLSEMKKVYPNKKTMAVLGSMLELGDFSNEDHQSIISYAESLGIDNILLVGKEFSELDFGKSIFFKDYLEVIKYLQDLNLSNYCILLKSSRNHPTTPIFTHVFEEVNF